MKSSRAQPSAQPGKAEAVPRTELAIASLHSASKIATTSSCDKLRRNTRTKRQRNGWPWRQDAQEEFRRALGVRWPLTPVVGPDSKRCQARAGGSPQPWPPPSTKSCSVVRWATHPLRRCRGHPGVLDPQDYTQAACAWPPPCNDKGSETHHAARAHWGSPNTHVRHGTPRTHRLRRITLGRVRRRQR